jgi:hypothetical protein
MLTGTNTISALSNVTFTAGSFDKTLSMGRDKITGCGGSSSSGIIGQVIIGPLIAVERPGMTNYRPYRATISVLSQRGKTVAEFESDVNGRFQVPLEPGEYILHPEPSGSLPYAIEQSVTVFKDQFTEVSITYDSGIR